jgi:uracil-DNA glycosylase
MIPKYKDQPPTPLQIQVCLPRLYEEIYIVDPLLIVSLGATAASVLLNRPVTIMKESGHVSHIDVPGVLQRPVLTDKKGVWVRKNKDGSIHLPTERSVVRYLLVPTLHPAFVVRAGGADYSDSSPLRKFFEHLKQASQDFVKLAEQYGITVHDEIDQSARVEDIWDIEEEDDND